MKLFLLIVITLFCLLIASALFGSWSFQKKVKFRREQISQGLPTSSATEAMPLSENDIAHLPQPVQKWLRTSGALGKQRIRITRLKQSGLIRLQPDQTEWTKSESEQIINLMDPGFVWNVRMTMKGLPILGMDQFYQGQGSMWITLFGLIPIVDVKQNEKINQSALQRFLGEIIWSPTAAVSPWVQWTPIDEGSARARMTVHGVSGEATFHFSESGDLEKFIALRFKEVTDEKPFEWHADIKGTRQFHGLRIPSSVEATWILPEGPFTWFRFELTDVQYE